MLWSRRGAAPAFHRQIFYHGHAGDGCCVPCALCLAAAVRPFSDFADVHDDDDDGLTEERWKECWPSSHARSLNLILVDLAIFAVFHKGPAPRVWNKLYAREKNLSYLKFEHFCNTKFDRI